MSRVEEIRERLEAAEEVVEAAKNALNELFGVEAHLPSNTWAQSAIAAREALHSALARWDAENE